MRKIKKSLYGTLAGCLLIPGAASAQSVYDPDWAMKLLPPRMKPVTESPVSPYNPNLGSAQPNHKYGIQQAGFFGDGTNSFRPTPVPGLKMMFQGDNPTTNGLPAAQPSYANPTPRTPAIIPQPMQMPSGYAPALGGSIPATAQPGLPVIPPEGSAAPQTGSVVPQIGVVVQPGNAIPSGAMPGMSYPSGAMPGMASMPGMSYPSGPMSGTPNAVPQQAYIVNPDGSMTAIGNPQDGMQQGMVAPRQGLLQGGVQQGSIRQNMPQMGSIRKGKPSFLQEVMGTDDGSCNMPCDPAVCGPAGRFWMSAEYAYAWNKGMRVPPLVTTAAAGFPVTTAGTLNDPGTRVLFGDRNLFNEGQSGYRLRAGYWFDCQNTCGIDVGGLYVPNRNRSFAAGNAGDPGLFRPFFNPVTGTQFTELVSFLNGPALSPVLAGAVKVDTGSEFYTGDVNFRKNLCCGACSRIDLLLGYRYLRLNENVSIREDLVATDPNGVRAPLGTQFTVLDQFKTKNTFNGGQIGLAGETRFNKWVIGYTGKIAIGDMNSNVQIQGTTVATVPGGTPVVGTGGLLAVPSNIGTYNQHRFAYVPEGGLTVGYQLTQNLRMFAGYNFLYASTVHRPGDQIDVVVNPSQLPPGTLQGVARPAYLNRSADYWMQTVSAGIELRF